MSAHFLSHIFCIVALGVLEITGAILFPQRCDFAICCWRIRTKGNNWIESWQDGLRKNQLRGIDEQKNRMIVLNCTERWKQIRKDPNRINCKPCYACCVVELVRGAMHSIIQSKYFNVTLFCGIQKPNSSRPIYSTASRVLIDLGNSMIFGESIFYDMTGTLCPLQFRDHFGGTGSIIRHTRIRVGSSEST